MEGVINDYMGFEVNIVAAERIGVRKDEMFKTRRWRPLKLTLANEEQKNKIINSVHKLEKWEFRVTDDFSKRERQTIKEWHKRAKERTAKEENESFVYKVRGSPRTKLYLKKISNKPVSGNVRSP